MTKQNKNKVILIIVGIIALTMASRLGSVLSPAISKIQQAFPTTDPTKVESIASIGDVSSMISAIFFGYLLQKITYKMAAIFGSILLIIGGLFPIFIHHNVNQLLMFALIVGLGTGAITTVIPSLTARTFSGKKLSRMFGINIALEDGFSMLLMFSGGLLAEVSWVHNYYIYGVAIITLLFAILFIPNVKPSDRENLELDDATEQNNQSISKTGWILIICLLLLGFVSLILGAVLNTKVAVYLHDYHIGGPSTAGTTLLFLRAASIAVGLSINVLNRTFRYHLLAIGQIAFVAGAIIYINFHSFLSAVIGAFIMGMGTSITLSTIPFILSNLSSKKKYPIIIGSFSAITSLGFAASTWFFKAAVSLFTDDLTIGTFYGVIIIGLSIAVLLTITQFQKRCEANYLK
ncbi:MFS transporter [Lactobacillus sp. YT155]|uniref:MFS transporter n=1 Tax=Lactobacillus sp. YT155 TaxID=3060955 RepID=UPI00265E1052|nr:MFS transporter [Lactobacillus sp. YT155]MDO1604903.1 MFS transporter [Lactobacillus sp. YT155]